MTDAFRTRAIRAGLNTNTDWGAVIPPLSLSSAYRRADPGQPGTFDYARTSNPNRCLLADALADLENAAGAVVTCSGMAAIDLLLHDRPHGARILCSHDAYGGTRRLLDARAAGGRFSVHYIDTGDLDAVASALEIPASLLLLETPSNPRLRISDIKAVAALCKSAGTELAVDNTVLSPVLQQPLALGADYSVQSITKLLNGHSDMVGGVVCVADDQALERLTWWANCAGTGAAAFDSYMALRGLRTLPLRAKAQCESAGAIAVRLAADPRIGTVDYPGLASHPGHEIACDQQSGFGQLISFDIADPNIDPLQVVQSFEIFTLAQSLGGVESLANIPATMTHASMTPQARAEAGIGDALIRLSIGLEAAEDLIADLDQALEAARLSAPVS